MTVSIRFIIAVICTVLSATVLRAQAVPSGNAGLSRLQLGTTFSYVLTKPSGTSGSFGLKGGGLDAAYFFSRSGRLGIAIDGNAVTASNIEPGLSLSQFSVLAGPRLRLWRTAPHGRHVDLYGQVLFGYMHGFNGMFPDPQTNTLKTSADSAALQGGLGVNVAWTRHINLRPVEADYVYSRLPNNGSNAQHNLRLSTGLVFSFR